MKIIRTLEELNMENPTAVAIGKFDGIHKGHVRLLSEVLKRKEKGETAVVFTFYPSAAKFFAGIEEQELTLRAEKIDYFDKMGIDVLVEYPLNRENASIDPTLFIEDILCNRLKMRFIVAGWDISFGNRGMGNKDLLIEKSSALGYEVSIIDKLYEENREISSTWVRDEVIAGNMEMVSKLLGRPYSFEGKVMHGRALGRTLGMPTCNLYPSKDKLLPPFGVYYSKVLSEGKEYFGITNVGKKPTVSDEETIGVETYLYDYEGDLYEKEIKVFLLAQKRGEKKFPSLDNLKEQVQQDIREGRKFHGLKNFLLMMLLCAGILCQSMEVNATSVGIGAILDESHTEDEYLEYAEAGKGSHFGYTNLGICNVEERNLNVRAIPSTDGKMVGKLPKYAACEVLSTEDGWSHIVSGKVDGYVKTEYLLTGFEANKKAAELAVTAAYSTTNGLNVREKPDTGAEIVTQVAMGEHLEVIEVMEEWVKADLDGEEVYLSKEYVEIRTELPVAVTMTELLYGQGISNERVDLVQYAKQFLGNPYVWGGTSLTKGADCSGFVLSVYKKFGISLPHSSASQANQGKSISYSEIKAGDLVFYSKGGRINHVAIYIGGGQVIHASSPKTGIKISPYNYRTPCKYVRIFKD